MALDFNTLTKIFAAASPHISKLIGATSVREAVKVVIVGLKDVTAVTPGAVDDQVAALLNAANDSGAIDLIASVVERLVTKRSGFGVGEESVAPAAVQPSEDEVRQAFEEVQQERGGEGVEAPMAAVDPQQLFQLALLLWEIFKNWKK